MASDDGSDADAPRRRSGNSGAATGGGATTSPPPPPDDEEDHEMYHESNPIADWDNLSLPPRDSSSDSQWQHLYANGRRYHAYQQGRYPLPNDEIEQNRDDMKHAIMMGLTDGRLFYAPLPDDVEKIIDVGTGTGIWAIEMGDTFSEAQVLGIDLSPIQPIRVPPNVRFMIDDCEEEWMNGDNWDYVHYRQMLPTLLDVPKMIRQTYENLKPGGYVEFQDFFGKPLCDDNTMPANDAFLRFCTLVEEYLISKGMRMDTCRDMRGLLSAAGFVNIHVVRKKVPIGEWMEDEPSRYLGRLERLTLLDVITAVTGKMFEEQGMKQLEREVWAATVRRVVEDDDVHRYFMWYFWVAQKPES